MKKKIGSTKCFDLGGLRSNTAYDEYAIRNKQLQDDIAKRNGISTGLQAATGVATVINPIAGAVMGAASLGYSLINSNKTKRNERELTDLQNDYTKALEDEKELQLDKTSAANFNSVDRSYGSFYKYGGLKGTTKDIMKMHNMFSNNTTVSNLLKKANGGVVPTSSNTKLAVGDTHEQGGIPYKGAEIEDKEVIMNVGGTELIFSNRLIDQETGMTYGQVANMLSMQKGELEKRLKPSTSIIGNNSNNRIGEPIAAIEKQLISKFQQQEEFKKQNGMSDSGKEEFGDGGIKPPVTDRRLKEEFLHQRQSLDYEFLKGFSDAEINNSYGASKYIDSLPRTFNSTMFDKIQTPKDVDFFMNHKTYNPPLNTMYQRYVSVPNDKATITNNKETASTIASKDVNFSTQSTDSRLQNAMSSKPRYSFRVPNSAKDKILASTSLLTNMIPNIVDSTTKRPTTPKAFLHKTPVLDTNVNVGTQLNENDTAFKNASNSIVTGNTNVKNAIRQSIFTDLLKGRNSIYANKNQQEQELRNKNVVLATEVENANRDIIAQKADNDFNANVSLQNERTAKLYNARTDVNTWIKDRKSDLMDSERIRANTYATLGNDADLFNNFDTKADAFEREGVNGIVKLKNIVINTKNPELIKRFNERFKNHKIDG